MQQTYIEKQTRCNYYLLQSNIPLINHNAAVAKDNKDRKSTRLNSSHMSESRMPSSA